VVASALGVYTAGTMRNPESALLPALALLACAAAACSTRSPLEPYDLDPNGGDGGSGGGEPVVVTTSDKLDVLFVVDNSKFLGTAHGILSASIPYLTSRLSSPRCVNGLGAVVSDAGPDEPCPVGQREFPPRNDVHFGVISTSLGGHGADVCSPQGTGFDPTANDRAHLLTRSPGGGTVTTYQDKGFLAWDPELQKTPPGESNLASLDAKLRSLVEGVGNRGCGFESQLESIYRFLVDPAPYDDIQLVDGYATLVGVDEQLLSQRSDFLRPDSALLIVLLTDENDCSTREGGQYYLSNQVYAGSGTPYHLPRGRAICATAPEDRCCVSCGQQTPDGCLPVSADTSCQLGAFDDVGDPLNLRCFEQKRRFGIDFLYPVERYVEALSAATIPDREGKLVPNPLFAGGRAADLVLFAGILGVPWQDVAVDPSSLPTGYKPAQEIAWRLLIGDPAVGAPPEDPLLRESIDPRVGTNPPTGSDLAPPGDPNPNANPINGHERVIAARDDLQFACVYRLAEPLDCAVDASCECNTPDAVATSPLCQSEDGSYGTVQYRVGARPALRPLRVLSGLGDRAVVTSICAEDAGPAEPGFGYQTAFDAMLRTLRSRSR
jgi:hypothetical protein